MDLQEIWLRLRCGFSLPYVLTSQKIVARIDYQDRRWRRENNEMEFTWRPFASFDSSQDIVGYELFDGFSKFYTFFQLRKVMAGLLEGILQMKCPSLIRPRCTKHVKKKLLLHGIQRSLLIMYTTWPTPSRQTKFS